MLKELKIQNFALISEIHIQFKNTFIVITGETGAGKSILLDALSLALGEKADTSGIYDKSKKSVIEVSFDISQLDLHEFFEKHELDYQPETILRREISADGKSRAFINDTPVNLSVLKSLAEHLIDIHSQHQNLLLNTATFRYNFIDALAGCINDRLEYSKLYKQYLSDKKELESLIQQQASANKEMDYYQFLYNELLETSIKEGELTAIEEELQQLENAETIIRQLSTVTQIIQDSEVNVLQLLHQAKSNLQSIAKYHSSYNELSERLQSVIVELKEIARETEISVNNIHLQPERIEELQQRINKINALLVKHGVKTDTELLNIQKELEQKLSAYQNIDEVIKEKQKVLQKQEKELWRMADKISEKRMSVKNETEQECKNILKDLAMPNAQFVVDINQREYLDEFGKDNIRFLFSANKGVLPAEIQKVASGGEIARLMLTIKSMMAAKIHLPTIIFDEIDTGVSGAVASKMGDIMKKMSHYMQVIAITHLPQIAAKGQQHFFVSKEEQQHRTISNIKELNTEERINEIAKMLSNEQPGEAAFQNAKELLNQN